MRAPALAVALALAPLLTGCATLGGARPWGGQATLIPERASLGRTLVRTAKAPQTWAPLAAAALLQAGGMDARAADWASSRTPVFGSRETADAASDRLVNAAEIACGLSILAAPSGTEPVEWVTGKAKGGLLDLATMNAAQGLAAGLKRAGGRLRPDATDARSMPSGHATRASVAATLAQRNLRAGFGEGPAATAAGIGTVAIAAACAWSRVEAGRHYPADALVGFAVGHVVGAIVNDAFVSPAMPVSLNVSLPRGGVALEVAVALR